MDKGCPPSPRGFPTTNSKGSRCWGEESCAGTLTRTQNRSIPPCLDTPKYTKLRKFSHRAGSGLGPLERARVRVRRGTARPDTTVAIAKLPFPRGPATCAGHRAEASQGARSSSFSRTPRTPPSARARGRAAAAAARPWFPTLQLRRRSFRRPRGQTIRRRTRSLFFRADADATDARSRSSSLIFQSFRLQFLC